MPYVAVTFCIHHASRVEFKRLRASHRFSALLFMAQIRALARDRDHSKSTPTNWQRDDVELPRKIPMIHYRLALGGIHLLLCLATPLRNQLPRVASQRLKPCQRAV
jgi:hypothetical protein